MDTKQRQKVAEAAAMVVVQRVRSARRRIRVAKVLGWSVIGLLAAFLISLMVRSEMSELVVFLLFVAGFGIYQGVRVLRIAKAQALAITVFENTLKEAYEKLPK